MTICYNLYVINLFITCYNVVYYENNVITTLKIHFSQHNMMMTMTKATIMKWILIVFCQNKFTKNYEYGNILLSILLLCRLYLHPQQKRQACHREAIARL